MTLYHYTCVHGWASIGQQGRLHSARALSKSIPDDWWPADYIWMTDLPFPIRDALGLTQTVAKCDRTAFRYRVSSTDEVLAIEWTAIRRAIPNPSILENVPGARPRHWWVSPVSVAVTYEPRP